MGGTGVQRVRGPAGRARGQAPGAEHAVRGLVGHHHGGHPGAPRPLAGPAQRGAVGDLQAVGREALQNSCQSPPVGQHAVATGPRQQRPRQRDHPPLPGVPVRCPLPRHDQHRLVPRRQIPGTQLPQRRTQPARGRGDEVRHAHDPQPGLHENTHAALTSRTPGTSTQCSTNRSPTAHRTRPTSTARGPALPSALMPPSPPARPEPPRSTRSADPPTARRSPTARRFRPATTAGSPVVASALTTRAARTSP